MITQPLPSPPSTGALRARRAVQAPARYVPSARAASALRAALWWREVMDTRPRHAAVPAMQALLSWCYDRGLSHVVAACETHDRCGLVDALEREGLAPLQAAWVATRALGRAGR